MITVSHEELLRRLKEKADAEGISDEFPPLTEAAIAACEKKMGVKLPELVRLIYSRVANGGVGPGEAMLGLTEDGLVDDREQSASSLYELWINSKEVVEDFDDEEGDVVLEWIPGVVPICYWGCAVYTVLDCNPREGRMVYCDLTGAQVNFKEEWKSGDEGIFERPGVPFQEWISAWLDDEAKWNYIPGGKPEALLPRAADQLPDECRSSYELRKRAEAGDAAAMFEYGAAWWHRDSALAIQWYEKAAKAGDARACARMARSLRDGWHNKYDWDTAFACNESAHQLGMEEEPFYLDDGRIDIGVQSGEWCQNATTWWKKRAENGDARAAFSLAYAQEKERAPGGIESAMQWYKRAAEMGHVKSQGRLSDCVGIGDEALKWRIAAADGGDAKAQHKLWVYYSDNDRDSRRAIMYLKAAAKPRSDGDNKIPARAMTELARLHITGQYVEQDLVKAIKLLERASKFVWDDDAVYTLAMLYKEHPNVGDPKLAHQWFQNGAERGSARCFYQQALCHEQGFGVPKNLNRALTLLKIAADKGHQEAETRLAALQAQC